MFCNKCGNKMAADAAFCNKCGAKMAAGDTTPPVQPSQPEQKTKSKMTYIIAGAAAVFLVIIAVVVLLLRSGGDEPALADTGGANVAADDPPAPAIAQDDSRGVRGNRIMIGETQTFDGRLVVTLDYIEFIDRLESEWFGELLPDAGNVFLRATLTVENLGTERGGISTLLSSVTYNDAFEFDSHPFSEEGQLVINALTPPSTGSMSFEVASVVAESDNPLIINISDNVFGGDILTFVIRPGAAGDSVAQDAEQAPADKGAPQGQDRIADLEALLTGAEHMFGGDWTNSYTYVWDWMSLEFNADGSGFAHPEPGSFTWWVTEDPAWEDGYLLHVQSGGVIIIFHLGVVSQTEIAMADYGSYAFEHFFFFPFG